MIVKIESSLRYKITLNSEKNLNMIVEKIRDILGVADAFRVLGNVYAIHVAITERCEGERKRIVSEIRKIVSDFTKDKPFPKLMKNRFSNTYVYFANSKYGVVVRTDIPLGTYIVRSTNNYRDTDIKITLNGEN